jgi:hypothetical protein
MKEFLGKDPKMHRERVSDNCGTAGVIKSGRQLIDAQNWDGSKPGLIGRSHGSR